MRGPARRRDDDRLPLGHAMSPLLLHGDGRAMPAAIPLILRELYI